MTTTQTITWAGKIYTFTTEGSEPAAPFRVIGSIFNKRGQFRGYVVEDRSRGTATRGLINHNLPWMGLEDRHAALASLVIA